MTSTALDPFLVRHAPGPGTPVAPVLLAARAAVSRVSSTLLAVPDAALETPWPWLGSDADVRYGFYRIFEALEAASADASRGLEEAGVRRQPAGRLVALTTGARWELHGRLAGLSDDLLDRDPGGNEWTLRQTLAHIVSGQRGYGWFTAWWLAQGIVDAAALPKRVPEDVAAELPAEETEAVGSLGAIRERLDAVVDASCEALGGLDDEQLAIGARWSGYPVTVAFRIGRWSSHLREHTVQVDKTLDAIGWRPREVDRLVGLIHGAYGRLEAVAFGLPSSVLERDGGAGRSAAAVLEQVAHYVDRRALEVAAAGTAGPS